MKTPTLFFAPLLLIAFSQPPCMATPPQDRDPESYRGGAAERVDAFLSRLVGIGWSGGIVLTIDGKEALSRGYGYADRAHQTPFTPETIFSIGSITKPITATCVMKLLEQAKLSVDDELSQYFPDLPVEKGEITLHELLTHSSGLPGALGYDYTPFSRDDLIAAVGECKLLFPPSSAYEYSNVGFALLAAVVELVSETTYEEFTQTHVFEPAGMSRTGYQLDRYQRDEFAHGYRGDEDWGIIADRYWTADGPSWHLMGNGGTQSSLDDMIRFHRALLDETLLGDAAKELMFTPYINEGMGDSFYGYGWVVQTTQRGTKLVWHNGGNQYFTNDFRRYLDEDICWFLTSNNGEVPADLVTFLVEQLVFGEDLPLPPSIVDVTPTELEAFAGRYRVGESDLLDVSADRSKLTIRPSGQRAFCILASGIDNADPTLGALTSRSQQALDAALQRNAAEAAKALGMPTSWASGQLFGMLDDLSGEIGPLKTATVVGTLPANLLDTTHPAELFATILSMSSERHNESLTILWKDDRLVGFDSRGFESIHFYPTTDHRFTSFDITNPTRVSIEFSSEEGEVSLTIQTPTGPIRATKI